MTSITSTLGLQLLLTGNLQAQQDTLGELTNQLSSGVKFDNLTDYTPTEANQLLNFQNGITQNQAYLSTIQSVQTRLSMYDTSMSDMENIASQASDLASQNENFNTSTVDQLSAQVQNYMLQVADDLNQQVGGRYIYSGTRYATQPVSNNPSVLNSAPQAIITDGQTLPNYDAANTSLTVNNTANTITVGGTVNGNSTASQSVTISINGTPHTYTVPTTDTTPSQAATYLAGQLTTDTGLTITASGATINVPTGNTIDSATSTATSTAAYAQDTVLIDQNYSVTYGVSGDNPSFQQLINGMRYINAAITAGKAGDTTTYQSDMQQGASMLNSALSGIQAIHANVAANQNTLTNETTTQNTNITNLQDQISNIQQVDITQVGTELNVLQTQLQASYSATGTLEQLSLVKYL